LNQGYPKQITYGAGGLQNDPVFTQIT
jgi:hypothetical protein